MEDKLFETPSAAPPSTGKGPSRADQARCPTPSGTPQTTRMVTMETATRAVRRLHAELIHLVSMGNES